MHGQRSPRTHPGATHRSRSRSARSRCARIGGVPLGGAQAWDDDGHYSWLRAARTERKSELPPSPRPMTEPAHSHAFTTAEANQLVPEMEKVMAEGERLRGQLAEVGGRRPSRDAPWGPRRDNRRRPRPMAGLSTSTIKAGPGKAGDDSATANGQTSEREARERSARSAPNNPSHG